MNTTPGSEGVTKSKGCGLKKSPKQSPVGYYLLDLQEGVFLPNIACKIILTQCWESCNVQVPRTFFDLYQHLRQTLVLLLIHKSSQYWISCVLSGLVTSNTQDIIFLACYVFPKSTPIKSNFQAHWRLLCNFNVQ